MRQLAFALALLASVAARAQPPALDQAFRELAAAQQPPVDDLVLEEAARRMLEAVEADPSHRAALIGLSNTAHAFATLGRWQSAELLWQRVVDEGGPRLASQPALEEVVAGALEQLARRAARRGDWSASAGAYRTLCDSPRFARSDAPGMRERLQRAFVGGAAQALEALGAVATAARYWLRKVERYPMDPASPDQLDHAAELFAAAGRRRDAKEASETFLRLYGRRAPAELVDRARARIARGDGPAAAGPAR